MTKADVVAKIAANTGMDKADVLSVVENFFEVVKDSMSEGNNIYFRGFGSFVNKERAPKVARNITKNTPILIEAHCVPTFKPSKNFVDSVKENVSVTANGKASN